MKPKDDTVTTETILEFHMGPEETKVVRCSHDSLEVNSAVTNSGEQVQYLDEQVLIIYCDPLQRL